MNQEAPRPKLRFDVNDPRFARAQELFAARCPEEGHALLSELRREWHACHTKEEADEIGREDDSRPVADTSAVEHEPRRARLGVA
jgi:hypothetical protein